MLADAKLAQDAFQAGRRAQAESPDGPAQTCGLAAWQDELPGVPAADSAVQAAYQGEPQGGQAVRYGQAACQGGLREVPAGCGEPAAPQDGHRDRPSPAWR